MKFTTLNDSIPYTVGGKKHFFTAQIYPGVEISAPGRHQHDTSPAGGDAVVLITDEEVEWNRHQFTHVSIFKDIEDKAGAVTPGFWDAYVKVIMGADPTRFDYKREDSPGIHPMTFLYASQVLALIEHRRYRMHEINFGGRFLPLRFGAGIIEGKWTALDAAEKVRFGRNAVERLEKTFGTPQITLDLMK